MVRKKHSEKVGSQWVNVARWLSRAWKAPCCGTFSFANSWAASCQRWAAAKAPRAVFNALGAHPTLKILEGSQAMEPNHF